MDIYVSVSDKTRHLTLDGDLDLLDRLLATIQAGRDDKRANLPLLEPSTPTTKIIAKSVKAAQHDGHL